MSRYTLKKGKYGMYFQDTNVNGLALTLERVLDRLNEIDDLKARLAKANKKRPIDKTW
jgi:hypothetical protein